MNFNSVFILFLAFNQAIRAQQNWERISESFRDKKKLDSDGWSVVGAPNKVTTCGNNFMLGGYNAFSAQAVASKAFQLPSHKSIHLELMLFLFNSWQNEEIDIFVDDQLVWTQKFQNNGQIQNCEGQKLYFNFAKIDIKHTAPTAVIVATSNLQDSTIFWGLGFFAIVVERCPDGCSACQSDLAPNKVDACLEWNFFASNWRSLDATKFGADGWETNGKEMVTTTCGGVPLFGGFEQTSGGTVISKVIKLPSHYKLKIKVLWAKIDSWNNKVAQIKVDETIVWKKSFQSQDGYFGKICGSSVVESKSMFVRTEVDVNHSGDNAKIEFTTTLDQDSNEASFGLRDFYIFIKPCSPNCAQCTGPSGDQCKSNQVSYLECLPNWYLYNGNCEVLPNFLILEQATNPREQKYLKGWNLKKYDGKKIGAVCAGSYGLYLFGNGVSATKTFDVPPHRRLRLQADLIKFGVWDGESILINVDGNVIWSQEFNSQTADTLECQDQKKGLKIGVDQIFDHQSANLEVTFTTTLEQKQNWSLINVQIYFEFETCAVVYSQCFFKGIQTRICTKTPNFKRNNVPLSFKSIRIPPQGRLTLFEENDYFGKKVTYTQDQTCLDNFEFSQIHLSGQVEGSWVELEQ